jgi:hypothetical protein
LDKLVRLGGGAPDQVDVGVDQAGQQRGVAEIHHPMRGVWHLPGGPYPGDAPILHNNRRILENVLQGRVHEAGRLVRGRANREVPSEGWQLSG